MSRRVLSLVDKACKNALNVHIKWMQQVIKVTYLWDMLSNVMKSCKN